MSTKSKLLAMTENLNLASPVAPDAPAETEASNPTAAASVGASTTGIKFPPVPTGPVPRTGPGQMLQFRGQILAAEGEVGKLRDRLREHEGSLPTRKLDTAAIAPSRWANRHVDSFASQEFARLKQDIESAGGNVQAISVRPLPGEPDRYEIVFGHRRHRACAELGLPVLAMIDGSSVSDAELFSAMDRENRERADLSPFEQGTMYRRALDEKLYASNRRLAEALGVSHTWVANVLQVADLPAPIVDCFRSPLEIQHRHAKILSVAYEIDRKSLLRRADRLRQSGRNQSPGAVVEALVGPGAARDAPVGGPIAADGRRFGDWTRDKAGRWLITLDAASIDTAKAQSVMDELARLLGGDPGAGR